jgi:uncharacterized membrane protein YgcG
MFLATVVLAMAVVLFAVSPVSSATSTECTSGDGGFGRGSLSGRSVGRSSGGGGIRRGAGSL